ncbi:hypothetical protein IV203_013273 [Nitzschia inconspicua]|uniref:Uncharacterized protein n=1 Tax=Nitzschia inconspicua TaxID=303405 RepID=A0A9K3M5P7_9STRA|nr:hypothetical protein IV203_013273 [Nitzschia inconspicua]
MTFHNTCRSITVLVVLSVLLLSSTGEGFSMGMLRALTPTTRTSLAATPRNKQSSKVQKITSKRRKELGINDDEDEYDLEMALDNNTDPIITKIIAGSLIVSIMSLLIYGIVIPATTDYGEGVCNTLLTGGRC